MGKVLPNSIRRVIHGPQHIELSDDDHPGVVVALSLRRIDPLQAERASEEATSLAQRYVHGNFWDPVREVIVKDAETYVCDDGETLMLTDTALDMGARVVAMQCGPDEDLYTILELLELVAKMPGIYQPLLRFMAKVQNPKAETGGKPSEESLLSPPLTSEPSTPTS